MQVLDYNLTAFVQALQSHYRKRGWNVRLWPFFYGADFLPITAGTTQDQPITIERDADFLWSKTTFVAFSTAGASTQFPNCTIEWINATSARRYQNQAAHLMNVAGTGQRPFYNYRPIILPMRSTVTARLSNLQSGDLNVRITIHGLKLMLEKAG